VEYLKKETLFVLLGISILLLIGIYKCNRETPEPTQEYLENKVRNKYYHLIVGSFENENLAYNFSDSLSTIGFDTEVLKSESGNTRVSIYKTQDPENAKEMKKLYRENINKIWTHYE
jgi:cell division protein FtsN